MVSVVMLSVILLIVISLSAISPSVEKLSVISLSAIMMSVVVDYHYDECWYAECLYTEFHCAEYFMQSVLILGVMAPLQYLRLNFEKITIQNKYSKISRGKEIRAQCYKTLYCGKLLPFHGNTIILCYKAILPW